MSFNRPDLVAYVPWLLGSVGVFVLLALLGMAMGKLLRWRREGN